MSGFRPVGFRNGRTARWRRASRPDSGRLHGGTAFRDGWTAWRRRASRNPAAPRNAVSSWEAGAPWSAASRWEAAANSWLGAIVRCSRTGSSNPSPSSRQSVSLRVSPRFPAKRGFSAGLQAAWGGAVGRDAQSPATSRQGAAGSLPGYIPVPQRYRRWLAISAALTASEVGWLGGSDLGGALCPVPLNQSRAGS